MRVKEMAGEASVCFSEYVDASFFDWLLCGLLSRLRPLKRGYF